MQRQTQTIDAAGKAPGRLASDIAALLIGKHKPDYAPNVDSGDTVRVVNADQMKLSSQKKMEQKKYYRHTGYANGLKTETLKEVWEKRGADEVLRRAVSKMLPKNKLRPERMKRLIITN